MNERLSIPGRRPLAATLDGDGTEDVVVACPPHPEFGGDRHDSRLQAVSDALVDCGVDCLRFDYGPWDEGRGERRDVTSALSWARERYAWVGLFGFSFGASMALLAAAEEPAAEPDPVTTSTSDAAPSSDALSALAPAAGVGKVPDALASIGCPVQVIYGERDDTAEWEPVVKRARELGYRVDAFPADHFFVGQTQKIADCAVSFLLEHR